MKRHLLFLSLCYCHIAGAQNPVGIFRYNADIGNPQQAGSARYDAARQSYLLTGGGYNIWFNRDEFRYLYNKMAGNFVLTANFAFTDTSGNGHRKIGWMIRESDDAAAASINAVLHGDGLTVMQWRVLRGAYMRDPEDEIFYPDKQFNGIVQLERTGKTIIMRVAPEGKPLKTVGAHEMQDMRDTVLAGLFIGAHDPASTVSAKVWNVHIEGKILNN
ncbi:MAG TPA: hypothetical protein VGC22_12390 [Chitinophaga sp.]